MTTIRTLKESPVKQGVDEKIGYKFASTPWDTSPVSGSVSAFDTTGGAYTDVTATILNGACSFSGDIITLPRVQSLVKGHSYKLEIIFITSSNNQFECYLEVFSDE